ncbi:hypothetical protein [Rickettsia rhipicephali]|uniref:hypothetical protein n=1 Tax=Rickettsia rhipicephali TaxID=33992 RepID=UPI0002DE66E9|nr:hypothetical protein [Rickettsia rhipicephali]
MKQKWIQDILSQAAAQAVANGDVSYGGVVVVAPAVASVAPVALLVLPADPEEDAEEVIAVPAVAAPLAPAPVVINMKDVGVVPCLRWKKLHILVQKL